MLKLIIPGEEHFDEELNEFITIGDVTLELEHSLVSLSKWESIWKIPFFGKDEKTDEQTLSYIKCMILTPDYDPEVLNNLTQENVDSINKYLVDDQTATWFSDDKQKPTGRQETITSELIYYWMVSMQIDWEAQYWHLNRLFTLIKVCSKKNAPDNKKKLSRAELAQQRRELNAKRLAQHKTRG